MSTSEIQREQQSNLQSNLWNIANDLRGNMDANEFKNYILGLIFYRYLSENVESRANRLLEEDNMTYAEAWEDEELREALQEELVNDIGYYIEPKFLYHNLLSKIETGDFDIEMLEEAINNITESTLGEDSEEEFDHLFDDMDLKSTKLGKDVKSRSDLIAKVMGKIAQIDFSFSNSEIDILGDAYEYLIGQFAANAGKKAGEFYTPQQVSKILAKIVTMGKTDLKNVYDPTCGSGSLLLRVSREANVRTFYGQELTSTTYNLARMNMLLHGVRYSDFDIKNDDTLENPQHIDLRFEAVVANPPYSAKWSGDEKFLDDERFSAYGKLAPKSKADFAFVQHMIHQLDNNGTMAVVLPHGVLFRGAAEGVIRKYLIEKRNVLDAVIGLPANIFFGTSIPTVILVFKKNRKNTDNIMFIDASNEFEKGKNQNLLRDSDVDKIIETYKNRENVDKYAYVSSMEEIKENDYNLNIPRYVDTFEEEEPVDIKEVQGRLKAREEKINNLYEELNKQLKELGL
ncbi:type I restriction-modification system subunit M [Clostridium perfringens]|uniref:site-specific DNA-methyltransferase (adenine-specific) n=1 Tax=Clostridium perfringens E str. JGS1987 TaxID=451755 RepID=B1BVR9_CLOPF|nr:type I restriction-modification system subunit M [Clostridium perfringens]EDT14213.1 type I restriction-modification system, M subunit [Clostridium perfringens E str. JGS1987]ELC8333145.1 type I restriction-modification system subunit M [Clostridium perfringens]